EPATLSFKYGFVSKRSQCAGAQSIGIALALFGQCYDSLRDDLIHDLWLAGVVQGLASLLVSVRERLDRLWIKARFMQKIENGPHCNRLNVPADNPDPAGHNWLVKMGSVIMQWPGGLARQFSLPPYLSRRPCFALPVGVCARWPTAPRFP